MLDLSIRHLGKVGSSSASSTVDISTIAMIDRENERNSMKDETKRLKVAINLISMAVPPLDDCGLVKI